MPSSDEEEEIYDGEGFYAALLACPAVVGDLVNIPVDLLPSKWVRACGIHPQTALVGSVLEAFLARRAAGGCGKCNFFSVTVSVNPYRHNSLSQSLPVDMPLRCVYSASLKYHPAIGWRLKNGSLHGKDAASSCTDARRLAVGRTA